MEPANKNRNSKDYLIKRIKQSGYPLEIRISDILDNDEYYVSNTQYYFDEDTKQGRDIDIFASPLFFDLDKKLIDLENKLRPFRVRTDMAIECKKSQTHAWVFYTRPNVKLSGYHVSGQFKTSVPKNTKTLVDPFKRELQDCFAFHYHDFERVAIAYDEIKKQKLEKGTTRKDNQSRREIFEAINQLIKFTCYETHQTLNRFLNLSVKTAYKDIIVFYFPIIVFDGDMFEVIFDSGEPNVERTNHIILKTEYNCSYCNEVESFTLDVVHSSFFSEFMNILRMDFEKVRNNILKRHIELLEKVKENRQSN